MRQERDNHGLHWDDLVGVLYNLALLTPDERAYLLTAQKQVQWITRYQEPMTASFRAIEAVVSNLDNNRDAADAVLRSIVATGDLNRFFFYLSCYLQLFVKYYNYESY